MNVGSPVEHLVLARVRVHPRATAQPALPRPEISGNGWHRFAQYTLRTNEQPEYRGRLFPPSRAGYAIHRPPAMPFEVWGRGRSNRTPPGHTHRRYERE